MKVFWGLGKLLTLLFWLVVLVNLMTPFVHPLHLLVNLAGGLLACLHLLDRLSVLFFGVFHLQTIPAPAVPKASHA